MLGPHIYIDTMKTYPDVKDSKTFEKIPETHFEATQRSYKNLFNISPVDLVEKIIKEHFPDYESEGVNDAPYQRAAVTLYNKVFERYSGGKSLTVGEIMSAGPENRAEFRSFMNMMMQLHRFSKRKMVFRFEEGLTAKLLHTDLNKVDGVFLESPYESLYLSLPHNYEMFIPNPMTGLHRVVGIYINFLRDVNVQGLHLTQGKLDADGVHPDLKFDGVPVSKCFRIFAIGEGKEGSPLGKLDDSTFYMSFFFTPEGDIFPQVENIVSKYKDPLIEGQEHLMRKLFSFCVNALLYINNPKADLQRVHAKFEVNSSKNKEAVAKKNTGLSKLDVVSAGRTVYITPEFRQQYRAGSLRTFSITAPMWMVRGHYRNQACGVGFSKRQLMWIEPYSKGKGIDDVVGRDYMVK